jgi:hypothetical protein
MTGKVLKYSTFTRFKSSLKPVIQRYIDIRMLSSSDWSKHCHLSFLDLQQRSQVALDSKVPHFSSQYIWRKYAILSVSAAFQSDNNSI